MECISGLTLTQEEQDRLYGQLKNYLKIDQHWLSCQVVNITKTIIKDKTYDDMPVLADALEDTGVEGDILRLVRERTRWVLQSMMEHITNGSR